MIVGAEEYTRAPKLLWYSRQRRENGSKKRIRPASAGEVLPNARSPRRGYADRAFLLIDSPLQAAAPYKEIVMKNGSKKKRAWTSVQVRELKSLARKKTPAKRIAKTLKRTEGATRQKAFSLGLSLNSRA